MNHVFNADNSGISCTQCGLPEANQRHWTPESIRQRIDTHLSVVDMQLAPLLAQRAQLRRDSLIWEAIDYAIQNGAITITPVFGYVGFNVSTAYDHGETFETHTLSGIWTQDGTMIADSESDRLYIWEVSHDDLQLAPNDHLTYYFKWWPNVERVKEVHHLSWDWTPINVERIDGTFALGGTKCEEFYGERKETATVVGSSGTLADQSAASPADNTAKS